MSNTCRSIQITTPKKFILDGLWFGASRPRVAIIFIHGLAATAFSHHDFLVPLARRRTSVIYFSNRGHDKVTGIKKINKKSLNGYVRVLGGETHEVFTDCRDDIQGAINYARGRGAKQIYLVGHSTGCQKIVYYLSRGKQRNVKGTVLLCPVSDYAAIKKLVAAKRLQKAQRLAQKLVNQGKSHQILPTSVWPEFLDAQRWLSLYTPTSQEEIFSYAQPRKNPTALRRVHVPLLVIFAGEDEHHDREAPEIASWFRVHLQPRLTAISIIPKASHNFMGKEKQVVQRVRSWLKYN